MTRCSVGIRHQVSSPSGPRGQARPGSGNAWETVFSARDGRMLERELLDGASHRLNRKITSLSALDGTYYRVGPVEQYLLLPGRVFFRGMSYHELHRLQFDLETTSLDPARGRIFLVA